MPTQVNITTFPPVNCQYCNQFSDIIAYKTHFVYKVSILVKVYTIMAPCQYGMGRTGNLPRWQEQSDGRIIMYI